MSIKVGMCGTGSFARHFIPLFKAHPDVEKVVLCDLDENKLKDSCDTFGITATCKSLDELCRSDVDAIVIITQHHLHGPQAVQALKAGKHVYSAVPSAISMEEITERGWAVSSSCAIVRHEFLRNGRNGHSAGIGAKCR